MGKECFRKKKKSVPKAQRMEHAGLLKKSKESSVAGAKCAWEGEFRCSQKGNRRPGQIKVYRS